MIRSAAFRLFLRFPIAFVLFAALVASAFGEAPPGGENLLANPGFEEGYTGYEAMWIRKPGKGEASVDPGRGREGGAALRVEHRGTEDWAVQSGAHEPTEPGEVWEISGWVRGGGPGAAVQLSVVSRDDKGTVLDWMLGLAESRGTDTWRHLQKRFLAPEGCADIRLRVTGRGAGVWWIDDLSLRRIGKDARPRPVDPLRIRNGNLVVDIDPGGGRISLALDGAERAAFDAAELLSRVTAARRPADDAAELELVHPLGGAALLRFAVKADRLEIALSGTGSLDEATPLPGHLVSKRGQSWILPVNEGIMVGVEDRNFDTGDLVLYGGHGLCMPFIGLTDGDGSVLLIAETPDDAYARFRRPGRGTPSTFEFRFQPSRGQWAYERRVRLVLVDGGHVAVAKAYRSYAAERGLVVPLRDKLREVPQLSRLFGAVDLWFWGDAPSWRRDEAAAAAFARELKEAGVDRVLWSQEQAPAVVDLVNGLGFLSGRYDIYQDVWGPDNPHDWVNREGWPEDLTLTPSGDYLRGWVDRGVDGKEYPGGVICSARAPERARARLDADLATRAYGARFIDTTTASPLRECYSPEHPASRSDDLRYRMELLSFFSREKRLVTGSETGVDAAVPYLHYFEGMESLGPYRLPDAGYDLVSRRKPDAPYRAFQVGTDYRIPLFQLVYHDCVVSYWYWGDSSNRLAEYWDEKDVFNALYGTGPLWIVDPRIWNASKARFIKSYRDGTAVASRTATAALDDHAFLTRDRRVQRTRFSDGTVVIANFGRKAYTDPALGPVAPRSFVAAFPDGTAYASGKR